MMKCQGKIKYTYMTDSIMMPCINDAAYKLSNTKEILYLCESCASKKSLSFYRVEILPKDGD
jgi:hypothetical protein